MSNKALMDTEQGSKAKREGGVREKEKQPAVRSLIGVAAQKKALLGVRLHLPCTVTHFLGIDEVKALRQPLGLQRQIQFCSRPEVTHSLKGDAILKLESVCSVGCAVVRSTL